MFCFRRKDTESGDAPESLRRLRLRFRGEVQGVGFRWTSRIVADKTGCTIATARSRWSFRAQTIRSADGLGVSPPHTPAIPSTTA